jgi:hypothetical protein
MVQINLTHCDTLWESRILPKLNEYETVLHQHQHLANTKDTNTSNASDTSNDTAIPTIEWSISTLNRIDDLCSQPLDLHYEVSQRFFQLYTDYLASYMKRCVLPKLRQSMNNMKYIQHYLLSRNNSHRHDRNDKDSSSSKPHLPDELVTEILTYLQPYVPLAVWGECWYQYRCVSFQLMNLLVYVNKKYMSLNYQALFLYKSYVFDAHACDGVNKHNESVRYSFLQVAQFSMLEKLSVMVSNDNNSNDRRLLDIIGFCIQSFILIDYNQPPFKRNIAQCFSTRIEPTLISSVDYQNLYTRIARHMVLHLNNIIYLSKLERIDVSTKLASHDLCDVHTDRNQSMPLISDCLAVALGASRLVR